MPSDLNTSSKDWVNLQPRSRIKNLTEGLPSAQPQTIEDRAQTEDVTAGEVVRRAVRSYLKSA
jgi:hypothetical protein